MSSLTWCVTTRLKSDPKPPSMSQEPEDDSWPDDWEKAGDVDN